MGQAILVIGVLCIILNFIGMLLGFSEYPQLRTLWPFFVVGLVQSILLAAFGQAVIYLGEIAENTRSFRTFVERAAAKQPSGRVDVVAATSAQPRTVQEETTYRGRKVAVFNDGTVEAETMGGTRTFRSFEEFKKYID